MSQPADLCRRRAGSARATASPAATVRGADVLLLLAALLLLLPALGGAQCSTDTSCGYNPCRAPASGVPGALWGELQPVDVGQLPSERDNSDFDEFSDFFGVDEPHWMSLDIENGWLFAAINHGLQVWDARGALAAAPERVAVVGSGSFPYWPAAYTEEKNPVRDVDAPPGNDDVVAMALVADTGVAVFDTSDKAQPLARYGDRDRDAMAVYAARIGSRDYAFAATRDHGLLAYDLTSAQALGGNCVDDTPAQTGCGVYLGKLGSRTNISYVDGAGDFLVASSGLFGSGIEIWNVADPAAPQLVMTALPSELVYGVALWEKTGSLYLGLREQGSGNTEAHIYDLSCLATASCGGAMGAPIWSSTLPSGAAEGYVTYSKSGGRDFLYFGNMNRCANGTQNEWLIDATAPQQAFDVTPPDNLVNGVLTGYWGWYYRRNPTGFNRMAPRKGKFSGPYFYRAGYTLFDVHELTSPTPPQAAFTYSPPQVYTGQPIDFIDASTGGPTSWDWTFQDASPAAASIPNPLGVVFSSPGSKTVTLTAGNANGNDPAQQQVAVLDDAPVVTGVSVAPPSPLVCQPVTFTAEGVTGLPPLTLSWEIEDASGTVATGGNVNPFVWDTTGHPAATYTATVTAVNASGSAAATSPNVAVSDPPALAFTGPGGAPETLNGPPFADGTVSFQIATDGATDWRWDYGDGTSPSWSSDPVGGPAPVHEYAAEGTYSVSVEIRNCVEGPLASPPLQVTIDSVGPLVAGFQAQGCSFGSCVFNVDEPVTFVDQAVGNPDTWDYDWDGDGTFEDSGHPSPISQHAYTAGGSYDPQVRVHRGISTATFTHEVVIIDAGGGNPSVLVSGPDTPPIEVEATYSAAVNNCSSPSGWSWQLGEGAVVSGSSTDSSIQVTYSIPGFRLIEASPADGNCAALTGYKGITVSADVVFQDAFESGSAAGWSLVSP